MADIPLELIVTGFVGMGAALAAMGGGMALMWRHFAKQQDIMRADFIAQIETLKANQRDNQLEIRELRRFERERLTKLASDSQELSRKTLETLRRLDPEAHRQRQTDTETLVRKA